MCEAKRRIAVIVVVICFAVPAAAQWQPQVHVLHFNEGAGTSTFDMSALHRGMTADFFGSGLSWDTTAPRLGAAALLRTNDDPNNAVRCPGPTMLSGSWTIEFWMRDDLSSSFGTVFGFTGPNQSTNLRLENQILGNGDMYVLQPWGILFSVPEFAWSHVAIVHDLAEGCITVLVDGLVWNFQPLAFAGPLAPLHPQSVLEIGGQTGIPSAQWSGAIDEFRIWDFARTPAEIQATMNQELDLLGNQPNDLAIEGLVDGFTRMGYSHWVPFGSAETLSFRLTNAGLAPLPAGTIFTASSTVSGAPPVTEVFVTSRSLATGQSETFGFQAKGDFSRYGEKSWTLSLVGASGPQIDPNDTWTKTWATGIGMETSLPLAESFDVLPAGSGTTPPTGWSSRSDHSWQATSSWNFEDSPSPPGTHGPAADHGTGVPGLGHYAVEDISNVSQILSLPLLDLRGSSHPRLEVWVHEDAPIARSRELRLEVSEGSPYGTIFHQRIGGGGLLGWDLQVFDLSIHAGLVVSPRFQVFNFEFPQSIVAIDDVRVYDYQQGPGQAPRPLDALMDLNRARSPGGAEAFSRDNGPYVAHASPGGNLEFHCEGRALQPIVLFAGPLNPGAATFPMIGQMDIGGALDPMTGVPLGIQLLADGITPSNSTDLLFVLDGAGTLDLTFPAPFGAIGSLGGLQALFATMPGQLALSNAIELLID